MRRSIITTIVFVVGMTVYLLLLGHVVENQQAMQREECAQAAQIYADELEKDFNTNSSVTETLAYMIADTGTVPQHFADVAKEMMATRPYVASIQLAPQGRVTDHRIGLTLHKIDAILDGDLDELLAALITADQAERLKKVNAE